MHTATNPGQGVQKACTLLLKSSQACHGSNLFQAAYIGAICRLLDSGGGRHRTKRRGVFSVQCGGRTLFLRAPSTAEAEVRVVAVHGMPSVSPLLHGQT